MNLSIDARFYTAGFTGKALDPNPLCFTFNTLCRDLEGIQSTDMSLLFDITRPKPEPLLWQSGYLTIKEARGQVYTLGFPNAEVREA